MKGFELTHKNTTQYIAVEEGIISIHLFHAPGRSLIVAGGRDNSIGKRFEWISQPVRVGDEFHIRFTEFEKHSEPLEISDIGKRLKKSKLELYLELKQILKEKGVLEL